MYRAHACTHVCKIFGRIARSRVVAPLNFRTLKHGFLSAALPGIMVNMEMILAMLLFDVSWPTGLTVRPPFKVEGVLHVRKADGDPLTCTDIRLVNGQVTFAGCEAKRLPFTSSFESDEY